MLQTADGSAMNVECFNAVLFSFWSFSVKMGCHSCPLVMSGSPAYLHLSE